MKKALYILFVILIVTCKSDKKGCVQNSELLEPLEGCWIPEKVNWEKPNSGIVEIDTSILIGSVEVLLFSNCEFHKLSTVVMKPVESDSIIFEYEPGLFHEKGKWLVRDSLIILNYSESTYRLDSKSILDIDDRQVSILYKRNEKLLVVNDTPYERTREFDVKSRQKIEYYTGIPIAQHLY